MANTPQAKKRARQNEKRRQQNASLRSAMRTQLKHVIKATSEGKTDVAHAKYQSMTASVDKLASKKLIHKNKAARHKSRLSARVKALAAG